MPLSHSKATAVATSAQATLATAVATAAFTAGPNGTSDDSSKASLHPINEWRVKAADALFDCEAAAANACPAAAATSQLRVMQPADGTPEPRAAVLDAWSLEEPAPIVAQIDLGDAVSCLRMAAGGVVRCFGSATSGQLGPDETEPIGDIEPAVVGRPVPLPSAAVSVAAGSTYACALLAGGAVECWGAPTYEGSSPGLGTDLSDLSCAGGFCCAVVPANGSVICWGYNYAGQLGVVDTSDRFVQKAFAKGEFATIGRPVESLACGREHACAVVAGGLLACWGNGRYGRLGYNSEDDIGDNEPIWSAGFVPFNRTVGERVAGVAAHAHTCAVLTSGHVRCWGGNNLGRLGYPTDETSYVGNGKATSVDKSIVQAGDVDVGWAAAAVRTGFTHSCALGPNGAVRCWGSNSNGQLGIGFQPAGAQVPSALGNVPVGGNVVELALGYDHTCALMAPGNAVRCWGNNNLGQLGTGIATTIGFEDTVANDWRGLGSAGFAVTAAGIAALRPFPPAFQVPSLADRGSAAMLTAGGSVTCVLLAAGGELHCWGLNTYGQLGYGNLDAIGDDEFPSFAGPVLLAEPLVQVSVSPAGTSACAASASRRLYCWGRNHNKQLGFDDAGASLGDDERPDAWGAVPIPGTYVEQVAASQSHTCAIRANGKVACWGHKQHGQLGWSPPDGKDLVAAYEAQDLVLGARAVSLATGDDHTCALLVNGEVKCWGKASSGQLGSGSTDAVGTGTSPANIDPVQLPLNQTVASLAAGAEHTCAVYASGFASCWGANGFGQLGLNHTRSIGDDEVPRDAGFVLAGFALVQVDAGTQHTCGLSAVGGRVRCWGDSSARQLGHGRVGLVGDDEAPWALGDVDLPAPAVALATGSFYTCVVLDRGAGDVVCWGDNWTGQLGRGDRQGVAFPSSAAPVRVRGLAQARDYDPILGSSARLAQVSLLEPGAIDVYGVALLPERSPGALPTSGLPPVLAQQPRQFDLSRLPQAMTVSDRCSSPNGLRALGTRLACVLEQPPAGSGLASLERGTLGAFTAASSAPSTLGGGTLSFTGDLSWLAVSGGLASVTVNGLECSAPRLQGVGNASCTLPPGIGRRPAVQLRATSYEALGLSARMGPQQATDAAAYAPPQVATVFPRADLWLGGGEELVVTGGRFGTANLHDWLNKSNSDPANLCPESGTTLAVTVGGRLCADVVVVADSELRCQTPPQPRPGSYPVQVCVAGQWAASDPAQLVEYSGIQLSALRTAAVPSAGGTTVTVLGQGFSRPDSPRGFAWLAVGDLVNFTAASVDPSALLVWVSPLELRFSLPAGAGTVNVTVATTVPGQQAHLPLQYDPPRALSVVPDVALAGDSGLVFQVTGENLAPTLAWPSTVTIGGAACEPINTTATELFCLVATAPSDSWTAGVAVSVAGRGGDPAVGLFNGLPAPSLSTVVAASVPTGGGVWLQLMGVGLGGSRAHVSHVAIGTQLLQGDSVRWASPQELSARLPAGTGAHLPVVARLVSGQETSAVLISYERPSLSQVSPAYLLAGAAVSPTAPVVVRGSNFPHPADSTAWVALSIGGIACAEVLVVSTGELHCTALPAWLGEWPTARVISANVTGQTSGEVQGLFEGIPGPKLSTVVAAALPTAGGTGVRLIGDGFGRAASDIATVSVGGQSVEFDWVSQQELRIVLPAGVGASVVIEVETAAGLNTSSAVAYDPPAIDSVQPSYLLAGQQLTGEQPLLVTGRNFPAGAGTAAVSLLIGGRRCSQVLVVDAATLRCEALAPVEGMAWPNASVVAVAVAGQSSGPTEALFEGVPSPAIDSVSPRIVTAGQVLLLLGRGFGRATSDLSNVTVGGLPCDAIELRSPTVAACTVPPPPAHVTDPLQLRDQPVRLATAAGVWTQTPAFVSYAGSESDPLTEVPRHVNAWRLLGQPTAIVVRWAFAADSDDDDVADIDEFHIEITLALSAGTTDGQHLGNDTGIAAVATDAVTSQLLRIRVADLQQRGQAGGLVVYRHQDFAFTRAPVAVRVRARNPTGPGPWSGVVGPVTASCTADQFLPSNLPLAHQECAQCPSGAFCGGAGAGNVSALAGFWRVPWSEGGIGFAPCPRPESCLGADAGALLDQFGVRSDSTNAAQSQSGRRSLVESSLSELLSLDTPPAAVDAAALTAAQEAEACAHGYTGPLCTACEAGYTRWGRDQCQPCASVPLQALTAVAALTALGLVVAMLVRRNLARGEASELKARAAAIEDGRIPLVAIFKVVLSHLQTVAIASGFDFQWPPAASRLLGSFGSVSSVSTRVLGFDCMASGEATSTEATFFGQAALTLVLPLLLCLVATVLILARTACARRHQPQLSQLSRLPPASGSLETSRHQQNPLVVLPGGDSPVVAAEQVPSPGKPAAGAAVTTTLSLADMVLTTVVVILFLSHMSMAQVAFQLLTCVDVRTNPGDGPWAAPSGVEVERVAAAEAGLAGDPSGCPAADAHRRLLADMSICCRAPTSARWMLGLGLPALFGYAIGLPLLAVVLLRRQRWRLEEPRNLVTLGFLYDGFRPKAYYWESVVMLRKVLVAAIAIALAPLGVAQQTYAVLLLLMGLITLQAVQRPYEQRQLNHLELMGLVMAFVTFECGLFLTDTGVSPAMRSVASTVLFLANLAFLAAAAALALAVSLRSQQATAFLRRCCQRGHALQGGVSRPGPLTRRTLSGPPRVLAAGQPRPEAQGW